jgi:hypothetical protein
MIERQSNWQDGTEAPASGGACASWFSRGTGTSIGGHLLRTERTNEPQQDVVSSRARGSSVESLVDPCEREGYAMTFHSEHRPLQLNGPRNGHGRMGVSKAPGQGAPAPAWTTTTSNYTWDSVSTSGPQLLMDGTHAYVYGPDAFGSGTAPVEQIPLAGGNPTYILSGPSGVRSVWSSTGAKLGSPSRWVMPRIRRSKRRLRHRSDQQYRSRHA